MMEFVKSEHKVSLWTHSLIQNANSHPNYWQFQHALIKIHGKLGRNILQDKCDIIISQS